MIDTEPRCWRCERKLAESVARPWKIKCKRCNAMNASEHSTSSEVSAILGTCISLLMG